MYIQYKPSQLASGIPITSVSLNLNLFFLRIMKEHCIFLEAGFTPKDKELADIAEEMKNSYDALLVDAIKLANGIVSPVTVQSQQYSTPYTAQSERMTSYFTGISIDSSLTVREKALTAGARGPIPSGTDNKVRMLNRDAHRLTRRLADFKRKVLLDVVNCRIFTMNYPMEIHHMWVEADHYLKTLENLDKTKNIMSLDKLKDEELFWDDIMMEHSKFTAGRLDPSEEDSIKKSLAFAKEFEELASKAKMAQTKSEPDPDLTAQTLASAKQLQNFQIDGTKGILDCSIQSVIPPLRSDHHVRETYYFIWLMEMGQRAKY